MNLPFIYILLASTNVTDLTTESSTKEVFSIYFKSSYVTNHFNFVLSNAFFFLLKQSDCCNNVQYILNKKRKA